MTDRENLTQTQNRERRPLFDINKKNLREHINGTFSVNVIEMLIYIFRRKNGTSYYRFC